MLNAINYAGPVEINGVNYSTILEALKVLPQDGAVELVIGKTTTVKATQTAAIVPTLVDNTEYRVTVRQYMTKPASSEFDFHTKFNNDIPMPAVTMTGKILSETKGMYKMELRMVPEPSANCMRCGRTLTHPVSILYGIGPECGGHYHISPYDTEEELQASMESLKSKLAEIVWTGWVIKSAIKEKTAI